MNEMISGDESQSTHMSEATITLSSPSQKLWLSQESVSPAPSDTITVLCEDINAPVTIDEDTVVLPKLNLIILFHKHQVSVIYRLK